MTRRHEWRRPPAPSPARTLARAFALALALALTLGLVAGTHLAGCGRSAPPPPSAPSSVAPPLALSIRLETLDADRFAAHVRDANAPAEADGGGGMPPRYVYAVDPPAEGDTVWTAVPGNAWTVMLARGAGGRGDPGDPGDTGDAGGGVGAGGAGATLHTLIVRKSGASGASATQAVLALGEENVLPYAQVLVPRPTRQQPVATPLSFHVTWTGSDPDGPTGRPAGYRTRLVMAQEIDPANPEAITELELQMFFEDDFVDNPGAWQAHGANDTTRKMDGVTVLQRYYLAVTAIDKASGVDPIYNLDRNLLQFRPTANQIGPRITMFNEYFQRTVVVAGIRPTPFLDLPLAQGQAITFNWSAQAPTGRLIDGYRWALDIADIGDETPRTGPDDVTHWSEWLLASVAATVGPFLAPPAGAQEHVFYVMARDNLGSVTLVAVGMLIQSYEPGAPLLVVDDMYGTPTPGPTRYVGSYPMEAEQDTFHFAVGGFPDRLRIEAEGDPNAVSVPGMFAGFPYDTLDYRFWPYEGLPAYYKYEAVAVYTDGPSAIRAGAKFGSLNPATALYYINSVNRVNTLALFSRAGGKLWLFGAGTTTVIANGYFTRIGTGAPRLPYTSGDDPRTNILRPGNFLWDGCHLRSELNTAGTAANASATAGQQLQACIPYLPEFRCPDPPPMNRTCDPRIGPGAERTALRWSGLPILTLAPYRGASPDPANRSVGPPNLTWVITKPLDVLEGAGDAAQPVADTLYLCAAREYDPEGTAVPGSDARPNAIHYYGSEGGDLVWMGFPLYFFDLEQARQVTSNVMKVFGIEALPAGTIKGAGTAHSQVLVAGDGGPPEPAIGRATR